MAVKNQSAADVGRETAAVVGKDSSPVAVEAVRKDWKSAAVQVGRVRSEMRSAVAA